MWLTILAVPLMIATCAASERIKLDYVTRSGWRVYRGQGYLSWFDVTDGNRPGLYVRDAQYVVGLGDGPSWHGADVFGVEYTEIPLAAFVAALLMLAGAAAAADQLVKRRLATTGRCTYCGYILKGLTEPRCPECATRI